MSVLLSLQIYSQCILHSQSTRRPINFDYKRIESDFL